MSWISMCCTKSSDRGWAAWIGVLAMLVVIGLQLYELASEEPTASAETVVDSERLQPGDGQ
ncbi:MAG: hypothetical protein ACPGJE_04025 [Wenzhouxiangellaceae bacterium]